MNAKEVSSICIFTSAIVAAPHMLPKIISSTSAGSSHTPGDGSPLGEVMAALSGLTGETSIESIVSALEKSEATEAIRFACTALFDSGKTQKAQQERNFPRVASNRWKRLCTLLGVSPHTDEALEIVRQLKKDKES